MKNKRLSLPIAAMIVASLVTVLRATTIAPYKMSDLQGLSQSADLIAVATIQSLTAGQRGQMIEDGRWVDGTNSRVRCRLIRIYAGEDRLADTEIEFQHTAADEPVARDVKTPVLLFLRRQFDGHYALLYYNRYGILQLDGNNVLMWLEGKEYGQYYTLSELIPHVIAFRKKRVSQTVTIPRRIDVAATNLPIEYTFTNIGSLPVYVMPPSYSFNSLWSRQLVDGVWYPEKHYWYGVRHWSFLDKKEALAKLLPGEKCVFAYRVPLAVLEIAQPGDYQLSVGNATQWSQWREEGLKDVDPKEVWFGLPEIVSHTLTFGASR
jgi:hypothetical protein